MNYDEQEKIKTQLESEKQKYISMADAIFDHPEWGFEEVFASGLLTEELEKNGFAVERGVGEIPTAFRAVYENGTPGEGPNIGLLCEYDAIKGMGHGCGHHIQGPAVLAAAEAVKKLCRDKAYRLIVYGTPAEETAGGKILMKEKGCFQDIEVALMMHPSPTTTTDVKCMALITYHVTFHGKAAHAAMAPDKGRSALDAILLAAHGMECLREHVKEDTRLHYTILDAGGPSNAVPAKAAAEFCIRSYNTDYLLTVAERVRDIFKGASLMTGTQFEISEQPFFMAKIPVLSLNQILMSHAENFNAPTIRPPREKTGSTDFGNVMYDVPGSCIRVAFVSEGAAAHSQDYLDAGKCEDAHRCLVVAAEILAGTCIDLIEEPELLQKVREEFAEKKKRWGKEL